MALGDKGGDETVAFTVESFCSEMALIGCARGARLCEVTDVIRLGPSPVCEFDRPCIMVIPS